MSASSFTMFTSDTRLAHFTRVRNVEKVSSYDTERKAVNFNLATKCERCNIRHVMNMGEKELRPCPLHAGQMICSKFPFHLKTKGHGIFPLSLGLLLVNKVDLLLYSFRKREI